MNTMNNRKYFADQFSNIAMMQSFRQIDRCLLDAFNADDHNEILYCSHLIEELINEVCEYVPSANA